MTLLPSRRSRCLLLFASLLAMVGLIDALAKATAGYGGLGFAVTLWACFGAAYAWLLLEPMIRPMLLMRRMINDGNAERVRQIGVDIALASGTSNPKFYVYDSAKFDVMVSGIGSGITILVSTGAAALKDVHLRAVLAHEFGHIRLRHGVVRLTLYGSLLALAILGQSVPAVVLPANLFALWTMRQTEFSADRYAVGVVGRVAICAALEHVAALLGDVPRWQTLFCTHPTFSERIVRLR